MWKHRTLVAEAEDAIKNGAKELDMVLNYATYLSGNTQQAFDEIEAVVMSAKETPVKVILEIDALGGIENILGAAKLAQKAGSTFVKTSTGFNNFKGGNSRRCPCDAPSNKQHAC